MELFVGAGGLALGSARAGLEHEVVIEWDKNACETLRQNKANGVEHVRDWTIVEGDVRRYDFAQHRGEVDFVVGGPPCQPFSLGGRHRAWEDQRDMFPEAVRSIRQIMPKAFIFENVKGLLRQNFANYYSYIIR
ncbi:MAG: DNA cytosine methyltransferase [Phycisphaeraceae bacterium]